MNRPLSDESIPTLSEVVPIEGATSISAQDLLFAAQHSFKKEASSLNEQPSLNSDSSTNQIADQVLSIVTAKLALVLPDILRQAVDEVLNLEADSDRIPKFKEN